MEVTLTLAIVTGLWYWIGGSIALVPIRQFMSSPTSVGFMVGAIMGDIPQGLIIGASIEAVYIGLLAVGGNLPADQMMAALIAVPVALSLNLSPALAISIAVPFGILGGFLNDLRRTLNITFTNKADAYAENLNIKGMWRCAFLFPLILGFFLRFPIMFSINFLGTEYAGKILEFLPQWLTHGLSVAGGILPALGFGLIIFTIGKVQYIPLFIIGFYLVQYFNLSIIAIALFGICFTLLAVGTKTKEA